MTPELTPVLLHHQYQAKLPRPDLSPESSPGSASSYTDRADEFYSKMRDRKKAHFPGANESSFVTDLKFVDDKTVIPTYRVLDIDGKVMDPGHDPKVEFLLVSRPPENC